MKTDEIGWKWLKTVEIGQKQSNAWKGLKTVKNSQKWLKNGQKTVENGWKLWKTIKNSQNGLKIDWTRLKMVEMSKKNVKPVKKK